MKRFSALFASLLLMVAAVAPFAGLVKADTAAVSNSAPVYRLANYITHERLFTMSAAERDNATSRIPGWVYEGVAYSSVASTTAGAAPVYRLANYITHERLFTMSAAERDNATSRIPGWVYEGVSYYAVAGNTAGLVPVYRLANFITHERLFTLSAAERDNATGRIAGWVYEGVAYYAAPIGGQGSGTPAPSPSATPTATPTPTPSPTIAPSAGNLVKNPSVETANGTTPLNFASQANGITASQTYETTGHTGSRSVKTTVSAVTGAATDYPSAFWAPDAVAVTGGKQYQFTDFYQSNVTTEVDVEYTNAAGVSNFLAVVAKAPASTGWTQISGQFTVPADAVSVTIYHVINSVGYLTVDDYSLAAYTPTGYSQAMVSFTFDDAWKNIYTNGLPIFQKYGINTTQYLLTGTTADPDYMTVAEMMAMKNAGEEIASHSVDHADLATLTTAQIDAELADSKAFLQTNLGVTVDNFATPYGSYTANALVEIAKYYAYHRSTDVGFNSKDNLNYNNIKVQNILSTTTQAQVQAWINQAAADKTWLVLVYHQVTPTAPAAEAGGEPDVYWTTPADLDAEIAYAKSKAAVLSMKEAITAIKAQ